jgi:YfiR/HmsC-like
VRQNVLARVNRSLSRRCGNTLLALACLIATHVCDVSAQTERVSAQSSSQVTGAMASSATSASPSSLTSPASPTSQAPASTGTAPSGSTTPTAVAQVVFGIISYTRWPADPTEVHLCIVPPSSYTDALTQAAVHAPGRPVQVQRVTPDDPALGASCDVIYIGTVSDDERTRVMAHLSGHPALTISEHDEECAVGSVFCLAIRDTQVSFKVNLDSLARSGVRVHPSVLQLAHGKATRQ